MYNPFYNSKNQYFTSGEQTPFTQNSQQMTPLPPEREPTIRELLEQNWQKQQNQQSQISQPAFRAQPVEPDYSNMSLSEELAARADYMKNQQGIKLPDNWLGSSIKTKGMTPVQDSLNQTTFTPQQLTSSPLPPYFPHMPRMLPKQQTEEFTVEKYKNKYKELEYMTDISHKYSDDEITNQAIQYVLRQLGDKAPNPLIKYALKYNKEIFKYMSETGAEKAHRDAALQESGYKR